MKLFLLFYGLFKFVLGSEDSCPKSISTLKSTNVEHHFDILTKTKEKDPKTLLENFILCFNEILKDIEDIEKQKKELEKVFEENLAKLGDRMRNDCRNKLEALKNELRKHNFIEFYIASYEEYLKSGNFDTVDGDVHDV
ncbi:hypothetical protein EDEG_03745 [Edhazardia aedis USNM 41457]|uniref:Inhibitor of growth protein N-terminal histone-binding domain-containing protein n=1 Tax=Edhazardia aedis (strain USNM 41457) TaxID=1003232 RepID=J9D2C5_EDHAE|nr:hypothetical protein EDEG_03745 [Edhazardia aedis USNM 41457]|eukprot:EJW01729.1 hypothetical protein EDEG_03745 [Edhazardia aedis USNM 41457]